MDSCRKQQHGEQIDFVATLPVEMQSAIESLFFFNPLQSQLREDIHATIMLAGQPTIAGSAGRVWIEVPPGRTQCLFACKSSNETAQVVGVILYCRPEDATLWITHLAVDPDHAYGGEHAALAVAGRLVDQVAAIARCIKGVEWIQLPYRDRPRLPVLRHEPMRHDESSG